MMTKRIILLLMCSSFCNGQATEPRTVIKGITERVANFSLELLHFTMAEIPDERKNIALSPIAIWSVFAALYEGSSNDTKKQISSALRLHSNFTINRELYAEINNLFKTINTAQLAKFNGIFLDEETHLMKEFQKAAKYNFDIDMFILNFNDTKASKLLNQAVSVFTRGLITSIVENQFFYEKAMVLVSAFYFKGPWMLPFNKSETAIHPFYNSNHEVIGSVNMMYNRGAYPFANIITLQAKVLELSYGKDSNLAMLVLLPHRGVSVQTVIRNTVKIPLSEIFDLIKISKEEFSDDDADCMIPRFEFQSSYNLQTVLNNMGIYDVFDNTEARLPLVASEDLFVSQLVHTTKVVVTEEGTSKPPEPSSLGNTFGVRAFKANRPFIFLIVEKTNYVIMFQGVYRNPTVY